MEPLELTEEGVAQIGAEDVDPTPRLGRRRDHTRDREILDSTLAVLEEVGYDGMTIDMVATRAKAGKATVYRRWTSKADLVIDAVACMKSDALESMSIPDTGTLRGDLIGLIKAPSIEDSRRKLQIMAGLASMLSKEPELAEVANAAIVEPRARINRLVLQRAMDRGEIPADIDIDTVALISPSMVAYRTLMLRKPVTREYMISVIDGIVLPAAGVARPDKKRVTE